MFLLNLYIIGGKLGLPENEAKKELIESVSESVV